MEKIRRLMQVNKCPTSIPNCIHLFEHLEITEESDDSSYYPNLCIYHGCKPVNKEQEDGKNN